MSKVRLGELLVEANIVSSADITEAIQVSKRLNVPIGRVLMSSGGVRQDLLEAALEAQQLINDGRLERDKVVHTLRNAHEDGVTLKGIVDFDRYGKRINPSSKKLADLLIDSEIVSESQISQAMHASSESGMPLGTTLVLEGVLSPSLYPSIAQIQENIRMGRISRDDGVQQIKSTFLHWLKTDEADSRFPLKKLEAAAEAKKFATEKASADSKEKIEPAESSDLTGDSSGDSKESVSLEDDSRKPAPESSTAKQKEVKEQDSSDGDVTLLQLLKDAGCFTQKDVDKAYYEIFQDPHNTARFLRSVDLLDKEVITASTKIHHLVLSGQMTETEAISAIRDLNRSDLDNRLAATDPALRTLLQKRERRATAGKVFGGIVVGAALAGLSLFRRSKGD